MAKKLHFLLLGTYVSIPSIVEQLTSVPTEELKDIAKILAEEYGIVVYKVEKPDVQKLFDAVEKKTLEAKIMPFELKPSYPMPPKLFSEDQKQRKFAPPNKGKISTKPKGRFKK